MGGETNQNSKRKEKSKPWMAESGARWGMNLIMNRLNFREGNGTPTPVLLPGKSHGRKSLVGCSPWGH